MNSACRKSIGNQARANPITMIVLVILLASGMAACGENRLTAPDLSLPLPEGWSHQKGDAALVLASLPKDLEATMPDGPRVSIRWSSSDAGYPKQLVEELLVASAEEDTAQVVAPPIRKRIDDVPSTAMDLRIRDIRQRYVISNPGADHVYAFVIEAPTSEWEDALPKMEGIMETVTWTEESSDDSGR